MLLIEQYTYNNKLVNRHPLEKFLFFIATLFICLGLPATTTSVAVIIVMTFVTMVFAGIPWRFYAKMLLVPGMFLVAGVIAIVFTVTAGARDFLWSFEAGHYIIGITRDSCIIAASLFLRSLAAVSCLYFLSMTTPITDLVGLLYRLRFPALLVEMMVLIHRCIFILLEVSVKIITAQKSRAGYATVRSSFYSLSYLCLALFLKSFRKSRAMFDSLSSRCYSGTFNFIDEPRELSVMSLILIAAFEFALVVCSLITGGYVT